MTVDVLWEPRVFDVGERVRIRVSAECRYERQNYDAAWRRPSGTSASHVPGEQGATGTVIPWPADLPPREGHRFLVALDEPIYYGEPGQFWSECSYAAIELEPIERPELFSAE